MYLTPRPQQLGACVWACNVDDVHVYQFVVVYQIPIDPLEKQ